MRILKATLCPEFLKEMENYKVFPDEGWAANQSMKENETQELDCTDMGGAINALRGGMKVMRAGWNGKGMWLGLQVPDAKSKMSLPYIYMSTVTGDLVPWLASQTDILAEDWVVIAE